MQIDALGDWKRTHDCGSLRSGDAGREVVLMGWVHGRRDLGSLIFIDLRDREGLTQVVFDPAVNPVAHGRAHILRHEWVIAVKGRAAPRLEGQDNPGMATGAMEVKVNELKILNLTETPPFQVEGAVDASEALRLRHRYLELRRPRVFHNFRMRHRIAAAVRRFLDAKGFIEVETPFLTKSTPEGARDYLVPSRVNRGLFYALPQSPQLFKQILMISGFDRYYQLVRCFRDEDLRADRQPEFTQVDLEISFADEETVMALHEEMMAELYRAVLGKAISYPFHRMSYREAMDRFGTDRPDIRFGLEIRDMTGPAAQSTFGVFRKEIESGGVVKAITVPGGAEVFSRKDLEGLAVTAAEWGARGLAWVKVTESAWQSPIKKFFAADVQGAANRAAGAVSGDLLLLVSDKAQAALRILGMLRLHLARRLDLIHDDETGFVWVTGFPMFEYNEEENRLEAVHHPFTSPLDQDLARLEAEPETVRARAYDLVLNGNEIGGGSVRIHTRNLQDRIFHVLGISPDEARTKFGFFLEALQYGAPPHAGMALGFDRLVAIMAGCDSIRDVIAFPKTQRATCPLTGAPSQVNVSQLEELGLSLKS